MAKTTHTPRMSATPPAKGAVRKPKPPTKTAVRKPAAPTKWEPKVGDFVWYRSSMKGYVDACWPAKVQALDRTKATIRTWDTQANSVWSDEVDKAVHKSRDVRLTELVSPQPPPAARLAEGVVREGDCLIVLTGGAYWRAVAFRRDDGRLWTLWSDFESSTDPGSEHLWMKPLSVCEDIIGEHDFNKTTHAWGPLRVAPELVAAAAAKGLRAVAPHELEEDEEEEEEEGAHTQEGEPESEGGAGPSAPPSARRRRSVDSFTATEHQTMYNKPGGEPIAEGWRVVHCGTEFRPAIGYLRLSDSKLCLTKPQYLKEIGQ